MLTTEQIDLIRDLLQQGETKTHIAEIVGCSSTTVDKYSKGKEKQPLIYDEKKESLQELSQKLDMVSKQLNAMQFQLNSLPYMVDERLKKVEDGIVISLAMTVGSIERKIRR